MFYNDFNKYQWLHVDAFVIHNSAACVVFQIGGKQVQ